MAYTKTYWYLKSGAWSSVTAWAASTAYAAGQWVRQTAPTASQERCFVAIFAGTSGIGEPLWNITRGTKTSTDGTVIWMECTGIPGPCGDVTNTSNWTVVKNTTVSLGQVIKDVAATTYFICTTSGLTGNGSEPGWNTTAGQTTTDGAAVWTSIGAIAGYATPYQYPFAKQAGVAGSGFMLAGETCYRSNNHAETQATGMTIANTNGTAAKPLIFLTGSDSVAPPTALATTATITTTGNSGLTIGGSVYDYGATFTASSGALQAAITLGNTSSGNVILDNCVVAQGATGAGNVNIGGGTNVSLIDSAITFGNTGSTISNGATVFNSGANLFTMKGGSVALTGTVPSTMFQGGSQVAVGVYIFRDVNLAGFGAGKTLINVGAFNQCGNFYLENCKLGASVTPVTGAFIAPYQGWFRMHNCDSGATNYRYYYSNYGGVVQQSTSIYNNAGATNGTTNLSWQFVSSANTTFTTPFVSEPIAIWGDTTGGSKTATIELTCASALNNNDVWIEIEELGTAGFPLGVNVSSRMAWFGTPTALTASGATWTGALANVYKIAVNFTPQLKGVIKARIYVAKPSATVYFDPLITVS